MDTLLHDVRYGLRLLRKSPAFTAAIILIVAIGVGAATTIFSIVESSLLWNENPNVDRWVMLRAFFPHRNLRVFSFAAAEYYDFRGLTDVFERVGAVHGINATLYVDQTPQVIEETLVTADMIPMTDTPPLIGRVFTDEDDRPGAPKTTVLTWELWRHAFGGKPQAIGSTVRIDDEHYTVIGVMPPHFTLWGGSLYVPFQLEAASADRSDRRMRVVGLIRRGVPVERAHARLNDFARAMGREHADTNPEYDGMQLTTWNIKDAVVGGARPVLLILLAAVGLIVAIASTNIGNLLLARAAGRRREVVVRAALGASKGRIVRQLLTESLLLSGAGGGAGVLAAAWGVPAAVALAGESQLPYAELTRLDAGALAMAVATSLAMGLFFGLAPALYAVRDDLSRAVREGGLQSGASRRERWTHGALVVSQVSLAMVVLVSAGLMIRTYRGLVHLDLGYDTHNALTAQLALPTDKYPSAESVTVFYRDLVDTLRTSRNIDGAAVATGRPLMDRVVDVSTQDFSLPGEQGAASVPNADVRAVSPGYFGVAGMHLIRGRLLEDRDTRETEPVAVVNETMAKMFWPAQDAVGQWIRLGTLYGNGAGLAGQAGLAGGTGPAGPATGRWVEIVGVVSDARQVRVVEVPVRQEMFFPVAQRPEMSRAVTLIVRSRLPTDQATSLVRRVVAGVDADRPIFEIITLEQAVANSVATERLATVLLGMFAAVALVLAGIGLYAVVAYSVSRLTREIGIRIALGATPGDVLAMTMGDGWKPAIVGLAIGFAAAVALTRVMRSLLFGVSATDPLTFASAGALLTLLALVASYLPARRAARMDPTAALRQE
jgi:putative ABC transport system permease protein